METIFTKIRDGEIPSVMLHRDELCFVILDIQPVNKGHLLVISNDPYPTLADCPAEVLSHMSAVVKAADAKLREVLRCDATNIVINNGKESGQEIAHLHIHVIPRYAEDGKHIHPAKESYGEGEIEDLGSRLEF